MNIKQAVAFGTKKLNHLENPRIEAEILMCSVMGKKWVRALLRIKDDQALTLQEELLYRWRIYRRAKHIPIAYITGQVDWNDLDLAVCCATLIPRDETETLCHHITKNQDDTPKTILDIGTGSGCIVIALTKQWPSAQALGLDISRRALQYARYNARVNHTLVTFKKSYLLNAIASNSNFDLIVANLPYVPSDLIVSQEVSKEPRSAIFSGVDGLDLIRKLAEQLENKKISFNQLWLEFLPQSQNDIAGIFKNYKITFYPAINGEIFFAQITPLA